MTTPEQLCHRVKVRRVSRWVLWILPVLLLLHQNYWLWNDSSFVAGLPVNLAYHVLLSLLVTVLMWFVVKWAWPEYPDEE